MARPKGMTSGRYRFWGSLVGAASDVSRVGNNDSGLRCVMNGQQAGAAVKLYVNSDGEDCAEVKLTGGSFGPSTDHAVLMDGPIDTRRRELRGAKSSAIHALQTAAGHHNPEQGHRDADAVLCDLLRRLGFEDVVDAYVAVDPKWYA